MFLIAFDSACSTTIVNKSKGEHFNISDVKWYTNSVWKQNIILMVKK